MDRPVTWQTQRQGFLRSDQPSTLNQAAVAAGQGQALTVADLLNQADLYQAARDAARQSLDDLDQAALHRRAAAVDLGDQATIHRRAAAVAALLGQEAAAVADLLYQAALYRHAAAA